MLYHSVYFWLDPKTGETERRRFEEGIASLRGIEGVRELRFGGPAATARPVIDRTYTYGLLVVFDDLRAHDVYQGHALHKKFLENFSASWIKVAVYDFEEGK